MKRKYFEILFVNMTVGPDVDHARWIELVQSITSGDDRGVEELYAILQNTVRANLSRYVWPQATEDGIHEVLIVVLEAIRRGALRDPARLMGFVKKVSQRHAVAQIRHAMFRRRRFETSETDLPAPGDLPDTRLDRDQQLTRLRKIMRGLNGRDREILERFYLREQPRAQICEEMRLTDTQFRLFKSRAITRCTILASTSQPVHSESRIA
jgi:RNA polymerase sigma-70 factor, ECF subfamily